jgi:hypothetical protein
VEFGAPAEADWIFFSDLPQTLGAGVGMADRLRDKLSGRQAE